MNSKEEILELLKTKMLTDKIEAMEYYQNLINAVEAAIFDVPSEEEIDERIENITSANWKAGYFAAIHFILNYKKP